MSGLLLLVLELVVLRLAQNISSSLVTLLIPVVLSVTILRIVDWVVWLRVVKKMRVVPHVRVWINVLLLPALTSYVAHFLLIVHDVLCVRWNI